VFWSFLVGAIGFLLAIAIAAGLVFWIRKPLADLLGRLVGDETIASAGAMFVAVLIGLHGLTTAFGFIRQTHLQTLFSRLFSMLDRMAGSIQWVIYIAALLFIGWSIKGRGTSGE
jgi:hypothetical protein